MKRLPDEGREGVRLFRVLLVLSKVASRELTRCMCVVFSSCLRLNKVKYQRYYSCVFGLVSPFQILFRNNI